MTELLGGVARLEITPPLGKPLSGNPVDRPGKAERVDSPLWVRTLSLRSGDRRVVLAGLDLLAVDHLLAADIRTDLEERLRVPGDQVMLWATHTHGGPAGLLRACPAVDGPFDRPLYDAVRAAVLAAVGEAIAREQPVRLGVGQSEVRGIGTNRVDPAGPMNATCTVLRVDRTDGEPLAALVHYACHPTLGNFELAYSADYPGYALQALEAAVPGVVGLFANGASGDVSTRFTRRGLGDPEARRIGGMLGDAAIGIYRSIRTAPGCELRSLSRRITLRLRRYPPLEVLQAAEEAAARAAAAGRAAGLDAASQRSLDIKLVGARMARVMAASRPGDSLPAEVQAVRIGDLVMVGIPGEMFAETGNAILGSLPRPAVVVGYANGYLGYLVPRSEAQSDSYESQIALVEADEVARLRDASVSCGLAVSRDSLSPD